MGSDWELPIDVVSFLGSSPLFSCSGPVISTPVPDGPKVPEALVAPIWVQCPGVGEPASLGQRSASTTPRGRIGQAQATRPRPSIQSSRRGGGTPVGEPRTAEVWSTSATGARERGAPCTVGTCEEARRPSSLSHHLPGVLDPLSLSRPEIPALVALLRAGGGSAANFLPWLGSSRAAHMDL